MQPVAAHPRSSSRSSQRRPQDVQERVCVGPWPGIDSRNFLGDAGPIATDVAGLIVPSKRSPALPLTRRFDQDRIPELQAALVDDLPICSLCFQPDGSAQGHHLLGPEHRQAPRLNRETQKSRHRRRLPDRARYAPRRGSIARCRAAGPVLSGPRIRHRETGPAGRVKRNQWRQMGSMIVAVKLQQIDLVGRRVVAHVVRGHSLHPDCKPECHQGNDDPRPLATLEYEPADEPVQRHDRYQICEDHPQDKVRAGDRDARGLFEQVSAEPRQRRVVAPVGDRRELMQIVLGGLAPRPCRLRLSWPRPWPWRGAASSWASASPRNRPPSRRGRGW